MVRHYFAYGSNMNPERVTARGLRFDQVRGAILHGVRLTFDKQSRAHRGSGHATLTCDRRARVGGVLYRLATDGEIERMDPYEAAPINYSRDVVWVRAGDTDVAAWTYFANPAVLRAGLRPERAYLNHLLAGRAYLSPAYYERLSAVVCADD
jgi:cation transport regulator ChaC